MNQYLNKCHFGDVRARIEYERSKPAQMGLQL